MNYPNLEEVETASHHMICNWWRFLPGPGMNAVDKGREEFERALDEEVAIMTRIGQRLKGFGGFTTEISKRLGWEK